MRYPIEYFFTPEKLKKGDIIILSDSDFLIVIDTVQVINAIKVYETFCKPCCELNKTNLFCSDFIRSYMNKKQKIKNIYKRCFGHFFDDHNIAWMHKYKLIKGGI